MPPLVNQLVLHCSRTEARRRINPYDMEPAFEWPCGLLRLKRNLSFRRSRLVPAAEDSERHCARDKQ